MLHKGGDTKEFLRKNITSSRADISLAHSRQGNEV